MIFTVFKTKNGWIVVRGSHSYVGPQEVENCYIFESAADVGTFLATAAITVEPE